MKISEVFKSIQGEGRNQGYPTVFIRFAGCNLNCRWCDTQYAREGGRDLSIDEILDYVWRLGGSRICVTGGEPLLQGDELLPLLRRLALPGNRIEIETNGTVDFRPFQQYATICMDVKCPSSGEESDLTLLRHLRPEDAVKFVVADERDCRYAQQVIARAPIRAEIFISPVEGSNYAEIAGFVVENNLRARFQLQLHKCIGVK
jgi:7-carboxy-7-deazaguanine synthase